jgi:hypothetical protein
MANADIKIDGQNLIVEGNWMEVKCWDIKLDANDRRSSSSGQRRALVHGFNDELIINYAKDYPGRTVVNGDLKINSGGTLKVLNSSNQPIAELGKWGNLYLGGNGDDGDLIMKYNDGTTSVWIDSQNKKMEFNNSSGALMLRIDADYFNSGTWPLLPGESTKTFLNLIQEIKNMKEEIIQLRAEVDTLTP